MEKFFCFIVTAVFALSLGAFAQSENFVNTNEPTRVYYEGGYFLTGTSFTFTNGQKSEFGESPSASNESSAMLTENDSTSDTQDYSMTSEYVPPKSTPAREVKHPVNFGARVGFGVATFTGWDRDGWSSGPDFALDGVMSITLNPYFNFAPELGFNYRYLKYKAMSGMNLYAFELDMPLPFEVHMPAPGLSFYLGPQLSFLLATESSASAYWGGTEKNILKTSTAEIGFITGLGWNFNSNVALDVRLFKSFTNFAYDSKSEFYDDEEGYNFATLTIQAGLTFMFR